MCRPKPGPRCAAHTRKELAAAQEALEAATARGESPLVLMNLRGAVSAAQEAYDSTPEGQQALLDAASAPGVSGYDVRVIMRRYQRAVEARAAQVDAERRAKRQAEADAEASARGGLPFERPNERLRAALAGRATPRYDRKSVSRAPVSRAISNAFDFQTAVATGDVVQYGDGRWQALARREGGGWVVGPEEGTRVGAVRALLAGGHDLPTSP